MSVILPGELSGARTLFAAIRVVAQGASQFRLAASGAEQEARPAAPRVTRRNKVFVTRQSGFVDAAE